MFLPSWNPLERSPVSAKARQGPGLPREFQAALCSQWKMASCIDFYSFSLKLYLFKAKQDLFLPRSDLACFAAYSPISPSDACDCLVFKGGLNEADVQGGRALRFSAGRHLSQLALATCEDKSQSSALSLSRGWESTVFCATPETLRGTRRN